jgi:hypothetical protein
MIPREEGQYAIKDIHFSYFDPEKKQYVNIPSPELTIKVLPGDKKEGGATMYNPKNEVEEKENDIRYIKTGDLNLEQSSYEFFSSAIHHSLMALPILLFVGFLVTRKNVLKKNSDIVGAKQRKAVTIAKKQLRIAEKHKSLSQKDAFYHEIFTALNVYSSNKLNIPVADLSKENIGINLQQKGVSKELANKLIDTLNTCEFAKYAPGQVSADLEMVYNQTVELISNIEDEIKV